MGRGFIVPGNYNSDGLRTDPEELDDVASIPEDIRLNKTEHKKNLRSIQDSI